MSITHFTPHILDEFGGYQPMTFFDRRRKDVNELLAESRDFYDENDKQIRFMIDAPTGLQPDNTHIAVINNHLCVRGSSRKESPDGTAVSQENFEKTISVDEKALDLPKMQAKLMEHTLVVEIPKKHEGDNANTTTTTEQQKQESSANSA